MDKSSLEHITAIRAPAQKSPKAAVDLYISTLINFLNNLVCYLSWGGGGGGGGGGGE